MQLLILLLLVVPQVFTTTVYVNSDSGSDTAAGTQSNPFQTINRALAYVVGSDAFTGESSVINLVSPTYTYQSTNDYFLSINTTGISLTITSSAGANLILYGDYNTITVSGNGTLAMENLVFSSHTGFSARTLFLSEGSTNTTLKNCRFQSQQENYNSFIAVYSRGDSTFVMDNVTTESFVFPGSSGASLIIFENENPNTTFTVTLRNSQFERENITGDLFEIQNVNFILDNCVIKDSVLFPLIGCHTSNITSIHTTITSPAYYFVECLLSSCLIHSDASFGMGSPGCTIVVNSTTSSTTSPSGTTLLTTMGSSTSTPSSVSSSVAPLLTLSVIVLLVLLA